MTGSCRTPSSRLGIVTAAVLFVIGSAGLALAEQWWPHAPELDPGTSVSGLALLAGGVTLLLERLRRR
jgi:hypothetical protein